MDTEEEENKKNERKGFAGLSSLVSEVDTTPVSPAANGKSTDIKASTEPPASPSSQPQPKLQSHQPPSPPPSNSSGAGWMLGIVVLIGLFFLIGKSNKTHTPTTYTPSEYTAGSEYPLTEQSEISNRTPPDQPQEPSLPYESKPPVGQYQVLSTDQIRYCLAEEMRMEGAKTTINNYNDTDVDRFNTMVADYNSRCSSFKYQTNNHGRNDLNDARNEIEQFRVNYLIEGSKRFKNDNTPTIQLDELATPESLTTNETDIESMLMDSINLNSETSERMLDSGTLITALANSGYVNIKPDARIDYSDYRILNKPIYILGQEVAAIEEQYFKEWIGCCVNPGIAITFKIKGRTDLLQNFAESNKCTIGFDGDKYYGPTLPPEPEGTYATLSCKEFDAQ